MQHLLCLEIAGQSDLLRSTKASFIVLHSGSVVVRFFHGGLRAAKHTLGWTSFFAKAPANAWKNAWYMGTYYAGGDCSISVLVVAMMDGRDPVRILLAQNWVCV
jgi:hypothetical protein